MKAKNVQIGVAVEDKNTGDQGTIAAPPDRWRQEFPGDGTALDRDGHVWVDWADPDICRCCDVAELRRIK